MTPRWRVAGLVIVAASWGFRDGHAVPGRPALAYAALAAGVILLLRSGHPADVLVSLAAQMALSPLLPVVVAHMHETGLEPAVALLARAGGIPAGVDPAGRLLAGSDAGAVPLSVTWELLALPVILRLGVTLCLASAPRWLPLNLILLLACAAGRGLLCLAALAGGARVALACEPALVMLGFLPLAWLPVRLAPGGSAPAPPATRWRRTALATSLVCLSGLLAGYGLGRHDAGARGEGRVLIDASRSDWEWLDPPFDDRRHGQRSVYSYSLWKAWIESHFRTRVATRPPSAEDLGRTDVLVIKTPTEPYDAATIGRIERFVSDGGGLFLIGDHNNLFGMATILNRIAHPYGIAFEHDDTFPLAHETSDVFRPRPPAPHPILRGIEAYPFETSCTLRVPWSADHVMIGRGLGAEMADYGHVNFFGDIRLQPDERFGLFVQAAALTHGEGRVVAFSDSTNFSNFSFLWPGRRELTLNVVDWLDRSRTPALPGTVLLAAVLGCGAAGMAIAWRMGQTSRGLALGAGAVVLWLAAAAVSERGRDALGSVRPAAPLRLLAFDTEVSRPALDEVSPIFTRQDSRAWDRFNAFFVHAARTGRWPIAAPGLADTLRGEAPIIMMNPARPLTPGETRSLERFLQGGGRMLVADSVLNTGSTSASILAPFGIAASRRLADGLPVLDLSVATPPGPRRTAAGGVIAWRDVGRGRVVAFADSALLSDHGYGGVYAGAREELERLHATQADLLRVLLEDPPAGGSH